MKCLYYLAPTLDETSRISEDLRDAGVNDWFMHVVSKDEAGLRRQQLHSSNYFETLNFVRDGIIGAIFGFVAGVIGASLLIYFQPFGPGVPNFVYLILVLVAMLFGAWEGGLFGVDTESQKLRRFSAEIDAGQYLVLIYARKGQGEIVKQMMAEKHPHARHVATDRHFINPFSAVQRKRRPPQQQTPASS